MGRVTVRLTKDHVCFADHRRGAELIELMAAREPAAVTGAPAGDRSRDDSEPAEGEHEQHDHGHREPGAGHP